MFLPTEVEHKIGWKTIVISLICLVEIPCLNSTEFGNISIEHYF